MQFPSSYASINPCFTAGNIPGVENCHAAWRHRKTTVCTSIVYGVAQGYVLRGAVERFLFKFSHLCSSIHFAEEQNDQVHESEWARSWTKLSWRNEAPDWNQARTRDPAPVFRQVGPEGWTRRETSARTQWEAASSWAVSVLGSF